MKAKPLSLLLSAVGIIAIGGAVIWAARWLHRPMPVALDDPAAAPIKDIVAKSDQLEEMLFCNPQADVSVLDEVYMNSSGYPPNRDGKVLIALYLGQAAADQPGYLNFRKAYHLWWRTSDAYPHQSGLATPTQSPMLRPTAPPVRTCQVPTYPPELIFKSIAIHEERAVVIYEMQNLYQATLIKLGGQWRIANVRMLTYPG